MRPDYDIESFMIYGLYDPSDVSRGEGNIHFRYIGCTVKGETRPEQHAMEARSPALADYHIHKLNWIRKVHREGREIEWCVLNDTTAESVEELLFLETIYIARYLAMGHRLTNSNAGGEGQCNPSPEVRAKIAASVRELMKDPAVRANLSAKTKAQFASPEARAIVSARFKGKPLTDEHRARISVAVKKRMEDPANREKLRVAGLGRKPTEATVAKMRESWKNRPPPSQETKDKISKSRQGMVLSKIHCEKLSVAGVKRWSDPAKRARQSAAIKEKWKDPNHRAKVKATREKRKQQKKENE